jgi:hypothetical protein
VGFQTWVAHSIEVSAITPVSRKHLPRRTLATLLPTGRAPAPLDEDDRARRWASVKAVAAWLVMIAATAVSAATGPAVSLWAVRVWILALVVMLVAMARSVPEEPLSDAGHCASKT